MKGGRSAPVRIPNVEGAHPLTARQRWRWEMSRRNNGAQAGSVLGQIRLRAARSPTGP